ncbi:Protein of unknown function [Cotesia congregata]|uniref:Uncharacterized protein n=1 Tax=Cotesia congregata TaxID=51543 RepID=A0A8J2MM69_COTCN|nr:Protein of unknown function [Cotesia congregata]
MVLDDQLSLELPGVQGDRLRRQDQRVQLLRHHHVHLRDLEGQYLEVLVDQFHPLVRSLSTLALRGILWARVLQGSLRALLDPEFLGVLHNHEVLDLHAHLSAQEYFFQALREFPWARQVHILLALPSGQDDLGDPACRSVPAYLALQALGTLPEGLVDQLDLDLPAVLGAQTLR